jgi:hypothetical protein
MHFIWINVRDFGEGEFIGILSALLNTSYAVILHTDLRPRQIKSAYNPYRLLQKYPQFSIEPQSFPSEVHGVTLPVALVSDIFRIKILYEKGGLYSDLDIIWLSDIPVNLRKISCVGTYDLQSYKHLTNSFMGSSKKFKPFKMLQKETLQMLDKERDRRNDDMRQGKRNYFRIYKLQCKVLKDHANIILPQNVINKNTHARIGRCIRGEDVLRTNDLYAFNWYNSMYKFKDIKKLPGIRTIVRDILNRNA